MSWLLAGVLLLPGLARATVAYVPVWRELGGEPTWEGVHVYAVPSLRLLQVRSDLPPARGLAVSNDYTRLYLWDRDLHVFALPSLRHLRTWTAFNGGATQAALAVEHPLRPGTVIFDGFRWFDTNTGTWSGSPYPFGTGPMQISDDGQWLTMQADIATFPFYVSGIVAIDLNDPTEPREIVCALSCAGVVAFGGSKLVSADLIGGGPVVIRDFATGVVERTFPPAGPGFGAVDLAVTPTGAVLIGMVSLTGSPSRVYRLDAPDGELTLEREVPAALFDLMNLGSDVLLVSDGASRLDAFNLDSNASASLSLTDANVAYSGPWLAPTGPTPLPVAVPGPGPALIAWLALALLALGMRASLRRNLPTPAVPRTREPNPAEEPPASP